MLVGLSFETKHDHTANRSIAWVIWYPVAYWTINSLVTLVALPKALLKQKTALAVWESPDRGV